MEHILMFILKLILFSITYYFMLDYISTCRVATNIGAMLTISIVILITFSYILLKN